MLSKLTYKEIEERVNEETVEKIIFADIWSTGTVLGRFGLIPHAQHTGQRADKLAKKDWKKDSGNYRPVSVTSVLRKVMEQIILSAITWHVQDNQVIRPSQYGFVESRSCLANLIFYDQVTSLVNEGKAVDIVYLDFSEAFDTQ
ncbi:RNA-directed DNA polymerase from mobile element jockey-like protein [Willisornis vidua]|uniref:RNA-directed DNA polymerase from mobile element jockey-like protein n=1 Tax=Willisornis vidua TaxID=1566151 RepID=A0ABQ9CNJ3_9PASS|nr:RNA-directed DNA polymerase from mobile element jockey-like protein [Willisornis vidua]